MMTKHESEPDLKTNIQKNEPLLYAASPYETTASHFPEAEGVRLMFDCSVVGAPRLSLAESIYYLFIKGSCQSPVIGNDKGFLHQHRGLQQKKQVVCVFRSSSNRIDTIAHDS